MPAQRSIWTALLCQSYVKYIIAESNNSAVLSVPCSYLGVNEINNTSFYAAYALHAAILYCLIKGGPRGKALLYWEEPL